jgi:peptidyl-dipeptidase Dcp
MSKLLASFAALVFVASCCPPKSTGPAVAEPGTPATGGPDQPPPAGGGGSAARDAALAQVAKLKAEADQHVLLAPWQGPYGGVPPWDKAKPEMFSGAFTLGIALRNAEIAAIAEDTAPATFANVFVPLQDAGRHEDRAETMWAVYTANLATDEVQKIDEEWSPKIAAAYDEITFNSKLFGRIAAVYDGRAAAGLTAEQARLVELTYNKYVNAGAKLTAEQKAELGEINKQLAGLFTEFAKKVLADENTWVLLTKPADLAGLPADLKAAYKAAADERKVKGWAVVNTRSMVDPFLASSSRRDLREKVWKAFKGRGDNGDANDTNATIAKIVELRARRAKLLGYATHAHWRMYDTMAKEPEAAQALMMRVWPAAVARVKEEVADMQKVAAKEGAKITIEPWDYLYYAEKVRKQKYALDGDALKPYFVLDNVIKASMWMAEKLYGLTFKEITGTVPVFEPNVRVWEVNTTGGDYIGLFYGDYFARAGKRSGAWAMGYRGRETFTGTEIKPLGSNNNNFVKAAAGQPVLISIDDAQTLFHEFGHGLHLLLSRVNYPGLAETPNDFVEYPSQVHEMWVLTKPVIDKFLLHYKTGKPMPQALVAKVEASKKFNQGYVTVEYLSSAIVDMALHTVKDGKVDADSFERDTLAQIGAPKEIVLRHRLPQFLHLFASDDYSAGYYSYLWSDVMAADTQDAFRETGDVFDPGVAAKMKEFILAPGNSTDRAEAYRQFRGRDPDVKALLEKRGFPTK